MNRLEEIQEIIKNFIYEKQQMKQTIANIEQKRTQLAKIRNEKKANIKNANTEDVVVEISELGNEIAKLGNQSQELQNKLDADFIKIKAQVNDRINATISEQIRGIRKIEELRIEIEEKITEQESRKAKYELQKQEFLARFGRMPELSEKAQKENEEREYECENDKKELDEICKKIDDVQEEVSELARIKREFQNGNWSEIIVEKIEQEETENSQVVETIEEIEENEATEKTEGIEKVEEPIKEESIELVEENKEEVSQALDLEEQIESIVENIIEEQRTVREETVNEAVDIECNKIEQEEITLPLVDEIEELITDVEIEEIEPIQPIELAEELKNEEKEESINLIEEIKTEEEPIAEIEIDQIENIEENEANEAVEKNQIAELEQAEIATAENVVEEISIEETNNELKAEVEEIKEEPDIEQIIDKAIEEAQKIKEKEIEETIENVEKVEPIIEENDIIVAEEKKEEKTNIVKFDDKVVLSSITAKIEEGKIVYKAQISNGEIINVYPTAANSENILLKEKENREELRDILINYAVAEYRFLDKKVIKKIDPVVCEVLIRFAKEYNYDAQSLIYNYAMSFSKKDEIEIDSIPQIIYNFAFIEEAQISKKEKEVLAKICKNARKNNKIEIIGYNAGFSRIKYIFKRTMNINEANALPEGKY